MLLHEGLTHIHSQKKKHKLHFGESFTLSSYGWYRTDDCDMGLGLIELKWTVGPWRRSKPY